MNQRSNQFTLDNKKEKPSEIGTGLGAGFGGGFGGAKTEIGKGKGDIKNDPLKIGSFAMDN